MVRMISTSESRLPRSSTSTSARSFSTGARISARPKRSLGRPTEAAARARATSEASAMGGGLFHFRGGRPRRERLEVAHPRRLAVVEEVDDAPRVIPPLFPRPVGPLAVHLVLGDAERAEHL